MSLTERAGAANKRMVQILSFIDENSEAARLQGAAIAGVLLGGWLAATGVEMGYSAPVIASIMTVGTATAFAIRAVA
ncbi:hypothetical protein AV929_16125 [Haloarcula sp. K1]|nr:hypothetical protein AV929_16125 [Haloarcula sp. K1]